MSKIQIDTAIVLNAATNIQQVATSLRAAGNRIASAGASAPVFEKNSFGPNVRDLCKVCKSALDKLASVLENQATKLRERVGKFEGADQISAFVFGPMIDKNVEEEKEKQKNKEDIVEYIEPENGWGISKDGPTTSWYRNGFAGCTTYVAEQRNIYPNADGKDAIKGNAQDWLESAVKGGWNTGKKPMVGSIIVFQGEAADEFHTANRKEGGHVAIVEAVKINNDTGFYEVTISEASIVKDKNGDPIFGKHTEVKERTINVPIDGHEYVDFIYTYPNN